jgi:transposase-like protein
MIDFTLPKPGQRWSASRKASLVETVRLRRLTLDEACRRFELSVEEFKAWEAALDRYGVAGLRSTRVQLYRETEPGASKRKKPRNYNCCNHS